MLQTTLCGIKLKNPTILASGILGVSKESVDRVGKGGAGAVTLKSICHEERKGHGGPNMVVIEGGMLNAVGLPGQGIKSAIADFGRLDNLSVPAIGSVFGYTIEQFGIVTKQMASLKPAMIELDISCPHMNYDKPFYADVSAVREICAISKKNAGKIPISAKLGPNVYNFKELCKAAEEGGADAITAINTASGMKIDIETRKPLLGNKIGGLSGPALKPIAIRCVYEAYETVDIPIIGTGGITDGKDAIEMIMAGATAVGIGTACYYHGPTVFSKICKEMEQWMKDHKIKNLEEIRGVAHE
jgi:dihydroorotate dehydrogenase (NAD+) catalytic subunit